MVGPSEAAGWRNWSGELRCVPQRLLRARSVDEVVTAVRGAAREGLRMRPVGSGHSFSGLVPTDGVLLDVSHLDAITHVDRGAGLVRVQAGITLRRLAVRLAEIGLAPQNLGDIDRQTLAGALATGTHGAGAGLANLSAQVAAMTLVDGRGEVHHLDGDDPETLRAARISLGALGVVTDVTLRVLPAYRLRGHDRVEPREDVLDTFHERSAAHRHLDVHVFPYSREALTRTNDLAPPGTGADAGSLVARSGDAARRFVEDRLLATYAFATLSAVERRAPRTVPVLNRLASRLAGGAPRIDAAHRVLASPRDVRFTEMELAVPREHGIPFVREVLAFIEDQRLPVGVPIEIRSVAADDALLSPAFERPTVYVAVHNFVGMPVRDYFTGVWELAQRYEPRPHWGKLHPATAALLADRYPEWAAFQAVRARFDPDGRFTNAHLDRVLGPILASR